MSDTTISPMLINLLINAIHVSSNLRGSGLSGNAPSIRFEQCQKMHTERQQLPPSPPLQFDDLL